MARLARMDEIGGSSRGGEGCGDLAAHMARFAHAGDDHAACGAGDQGHGGVEPGGKAAGGLQQGRLQRGDPGPLEAEGAQGRKGRGWGLVEGQGRCVHGLCLPL